MKKVVLAAAVSAALSPAAFAADPMTIVITASRTEQALQEVEETTQVITEKEIEQQQPASLPNFLAKQPGLQLQNSGGQGKTSSLYLRGLSQKHLLVLIDGVPVGSATSGTASLEHIDPNIIERIEIVRGPKSSLYGGNANAGVIQIFTKAATAKKSGGSLKVGIGSQKTHDASITARTVNEGTRLAVTVSKYKTDGIDSIDNGIDEDDGYQNQSLGLNVSQDIGNIARVHAGITRTEGESEYDDCGSLTDNCKNDFVYQTVQTGFDAQLTDATDLNTRISHKKDANRSIKDGDKGDLFETTTLNYSSILSSAITANTQIQAGLDFQKDDVGSSTPSNSEYEVTTRDNTGVFIAGGYDNNQVNAEVSFRYDDNESFGDFKTYGLGAGYKFNKLFKLSGNLATGFKTPTFNDLYYPNYGNPDAEPETYTTTSISATLTPASNFKTIATIYRTEVDDPLNVQDNTVENGDDSRITGLEISAHYTLANVELYALLEHLDPISKENGEDLYFIAKNKATLSADITIDKITLGADAEYVGKRKTGKSPITELESYTLVNLNSSYALQKNLILGINVKNALDEDYTSNVTWTGDKYNTEGRTVFGSVRYRF